MSWLFASGGQSPGASAPVLPMSIQGWFPLGLPSLISLQSKRVSRVFSSTRVQKHQVFARQPSLWSNSHLYMTTGITIVLTIWNFVSKVMSLVFNILSRFVIAFLPRSKCLLILWLQLPVRSGAHKNKVCHYFHFCPIYLPWSDGTEFHNLSVLNIEF